MKRVPLIPALLLFTTLALAYTAALAARGYDPTTLVYPTYKHDLGMHHVTDTHLRIFTGNRHRFRSPRGVAAVKLRERDKPNKIGDDDELTVYGLNAGEHIIIYNTSMVSLDTYGGEGSGKYQLRNPHGITADPAGNVYVADTGNDRVVHLRNHDGKLRPLRIFGGDANPDDALRLRAPEGIDMTTGGDVYVADTGNDRIVVVRKDGRFARTIGESTLEAPTALAIVDREERWSYHKAAFLVVIERDGTMLHKYDLAGNETGSVTREELGLPGARFRGIAIDYYHQLYVTDEANHQVHKLNRDLQLITSFGREGSGDAEFQGPYGIAIWRRFGQIFISESSGAQYYWIGVDVLDYHAEPAVIQEKGKIRFRNTERARVTVTVRDQDNHVLRTIIENRVVPTGSQTFIWNGKNDAGDRLPAGRYTVHILARPTYSSKSYFQKEVAFPVRLG